MLDVFGVPPSYPGGSGQDVQVFYTSGATTAWQVWDKPRGASMHFMIGISSGGGGGGGFTGIASSARGGGGGGGSGAVTKLLVCSLFIPDRLYIQVAQGGIASTGSGVAGGAGANSFISTAPGSVVIQDLFLASGGATVAGGGGAGTAAVVGAAGAANGISSASRCRLIQCGSSDFVAGDTGNAGGAVAGGAGVVGTIWNTVPTNGGSGGGGTTSADFAGGNISTSCSFLQNIPVLGGVAGSNPGNSGDLLMGGWYPFVAMGGTGGGASNAGVGGRGGNGSIGCGGGGGGGGTTGGAGGRGGDGLVIIVSW